jgi:ABC-2 type transport system permease protein
MKLMKLIGKNFRILTRSKVSSLIIIFGPLLMMFLAGYAFNNDSTFDLQVGAYTHTQTELTDRFVNELEGKFGLTQYEELAKCEEEVTSLKIHACLEFSENFELVEGQQNNINIYVDNSKINIVDLIQNVLNEVIFVENTEISADLTSVLLVSITDVTKKLDTWKNTNVGDISNLNNYLTDEFSKDQAGVEALDVSYSKNDDRLTTLTDTTTAITNQIVFLKKDAQDAISLTKSFIGDIEDLNGTLTGLSELISETEDELDTLDSLVINHTESTIDSTSFKTTVNGVVDLVNGIQKKMDATAAFKSSYTTKYGDYSTKITEINTKLTSLSNSFDQLSTQLKSIKIKNASNIVSPVTSEIIPVATKSTKLSYIFPSLMMLVIMFVCIMLSATIVVVEKLSPAKFRLFTTPAADINYILSNMLTVFLVALFQIVLLLLIGVFVFDLPILDNIHNSFIILLLAALIFTLIGMILGYMFSSEQTTILAAISVASSFLLVSDLILPLESIGEAMRVIISQTPFVLLTTLLRRTLIFDASLMELGRPFLVSIGYCIALFVIIWSAHKLLKFLFLFNNTKNGKKK